ncbi:MAG: TrmH family RNA methyltransferase [Flavobacteriales bacterium]|nr:TrmH family RNA methyltransferase [Flavobacteriales bacterium]
MNRKLQPREMQRISTQEYAEYQKFPVYIAADNIRSLSNIGALFRTADAFRVAGIFLSGITAVPPHREIHKTALGAEFSVPWKYFENPETLAFHLDSLGGSVLCLEQTTAAVSLPDVDFSAMPEPYTLIAGNEVDGVCDVLVQRYPAIEIPQFGVKHSFNVSVSVGIALWEIFRQKKSPNQRG